MTNKRYWLLSLGIVVLLSFYPLLMGGQVLWDYLREGHVMAEDYPKYVIPYTPIALALIASVAVLPLAVKACKRHALPVVTLFGLGCFLLAEVLFERVVVFEAGELTEVGAWQAYMCYATPEAMGVQTFIEGRLTDRYSPVFKVHFYLISILIVVAVIGVVHGFGRMVRERDNAKRKSLTLQTMAVGTFIGLCILACFTSFYRTGELHISPLSSWLMSAFFIVFGLTAGVYCGGLTYGPKPLLSCWIPALIASATTLVMYIGELVLMGGVLFRFGQGVMFTPVSTTPFAPVDIAVILLSGLIIYAILALVRPKPIKFLTTPTNPVPRD